MFLKHNFNIEECENVCKRKSKKCSRSTLAARTIAISAFVLGVIMMSIVYHAVVLERIEKIRQIIALSKEYQQDSNSPVGDVFNTAEVTSDIQVLGSITENGSNKFGESPRKEQFLRRRYFRRRISRDLSDLLDPVRMTEDGPNFRELYTRVRSKRAQIALAKLEKEYNRCKKESANGRDCMLAFAKMYNLAKEISEKMEKMKEIFKDSEKLLEQKNVSSSQESLEWRHDRIEDGGKEEGMEFQTTSRITRVEEQQISEGGAEMKIDVRTTTTTAVSTKLTTPCRDYTTMKPRVIQIQPLPTTKTTTATTTTTTTTTTIRTTTEKLFCPMSHSTESPKIADVTQIIKPVNSNVETVTEIFHARKLENLNFKPIAIEHHKDVKEFESTGDDDIKCEEERLRKLKFDWIIDDEELTSDEEESKDLKSDKTSKAAVNSTTPKVKTISETVSPPTTATTATSTTMTDAKTTTTPASPTLEPITYTWIIDTDLKTRTAGAETTMSKQDVKNRSNCDTKSPDSGCNTAATPNKAGCTDRPLHDQAESDRSVQHLLNHSSSRVKTSGDGFERHKSDKMNTQANKGAINPYDQKEWEKKFQQAAKAPGRQESINTKSKVKMVPKICSSSRQSSADDQLLSLCDRVSMNTPNDDDSFVPDYDSENYTQSSISQFTSRAPGGFPVTGETMKASAQFIFNPNFGMPTIPVCFYATPTSFRIPNQMPMWSPTFFGNPGGNFGGSGTTLWAGSGGPGGVFFVPQQIGTAANFVGLSGAMGGSSSPQANIPNIFSKANSPQNQPQNQQVFCTYMQNKDNNSNNNGEAQHGGTNNGPANGGNSIGFSNANFKLRNFNQTSSADIVYASYDGIPKLLGSADRSGKCKLLDEKACYGGNECIRSDAWCDGRVDCTDGSDEAACTCRDRLYSDRICDGYTDCPMGEDEIGCFGCQEFMFSCYESVEEYEHFNRSALSMCYSSMEKCDGFNNCLNGRDEIDCSIIVKDVTNHMSHSVSASEGVLYRNHRGSWYPACNNAEKWAKEACESEGGFSGLPLITHRSQSLSGPFIEPSFPGNMQFPQTCQKREGRNVLADHVAYVTCSPAKCGIRRKSVKHPVQLRSKRHSQLVEAATKGGEWNVGGVRIVGGRQSRPENWPFVVAVYRNGNFHCGGSIYSERWIISAAHCVINYQKYYYEVRAGTLRRSSYAASTQIQPVTHIVVHQAYERRTMRNDLSLLRLAEPLRLNRWVKPICLPDRARTTQGDDWVWGPEENTICYTVGWGAVREKGPGSDYLREVSVPIRSRCKEKEDQAAESICAGDVDGGRDACQGDSGGPLFCRSLSNHDEWYLAGVVSHGNGCARVGEFGVYTRVALFLDWIEMATRSEYLPLQQPLLLCPGYMCVWGGQRCISQRRRCNRIVDCLGGEDEVGCIHNFIPDVTSTKNGTLKKDDCKQVGALKSRIGEGRQAEAPEEDDEEEKEEEKQEHELESLEIVDVESTTKMSVIAPSTTTAAPISFDISTNNVDTVDQTTFDKEIHTKDIIRETTTLTIPIKDMTDATLLPATSTPIPSSTTFSPIDFEDSLNPEQTGTTSLVTTIKATTESVKDKRFTVSTTTASSSFETTEPTVVKFKKAKLSPVKLQVVEPQKLNTTGRRGFTSKAPQKFVCQKILQIIDTKHYCDRVLDCEDGTDEDDCLCRDYLKGSLSILICDGKPDCEDLTDESDCGNCTASEFYCPVSRTCIPSQKRCDISFDCKFKEDEQDCFALTNGKQITVDSHKKPFLNSAGFFSRNKHGSWRVVCLQETVFHRNPTQEATEVCSLLGFHGYKFYNITKFGGNSSSAESNLDQQLDASRGRLYSLRMRTAEGSEDTSDVCSLLFLECEVKSKEILPLKTFSAGQEIVPPQSVNSHGLKPMLAPNGRPNVFVKPHRGTWLLEEEILRKLQKVLESKEKLAVMVRDKIHEALAEFHWPWLVDVYVNGRLWCIGVLLDGHWIMVHESCQHGIRFGDDYVAALFGGGKTKALPHKSNEEQIRRVDCYDAVVNSEVLLYHLDRSVRFTHHVLPTFLPDLPHMSDSSTHECLAIAHDAHTGRAKALAVIEHQNASICERSAELSCYQLSERKIYQPAEREKVSELQQTNVNWQTRETQDAMLPQAADCENFGNKNSGFKFTPDPTDQAVLVCRGNDTGWYPKALFSYNNTDCSSFRQPFGIRTLPHVYNVIEELIDNSKCRFSHEAPACSTFRCPLGTCLRAEQICDLHHDCHDGSDEDKTMCAQRKQVCKSSELKCRSLNKCVPKTKFCDHVPDCDDLTDEPTVCSCFTYLRAADPDKICDGIRNCWDKSDESPVLCNCTEQRFTCGSSEECIPYEFVCDKELDCPNGEDEAFCYGLEHPVDKVFQKPYDWNKSTQHSEYVSPPHYGQVIEQSYGVWHTKCFPRDSPPDVAEVRMICRKLGYTPYRQPIYRLIDDAAGRLVESNVGFDQRGRHFSGNSLIGRYRLSTKAEIVSRFSPLHLNDQLTLFMKPSRPIAELVRWNATDSARCFRLEIKCA